MIKRILLIDIEDIRPDVKDGQVFTNWTHHPIGLMYLAAAARKAFPDLVLKIFHTATVHNPNECIESLVVDFNPDLIGLRALSIAQESLRNVAERIRKLPAHVPIIAGGPYPSVASEDLLASSLVDLVVIGEGEVTFVEIIRRIKEEGKLPQDVAGTAVRESGKVRMNVPRQPISDLDSIPVPGYEFIQLEDYSHISNLGFQNSSKCAFIFNSRGCPFHCFYCHQLFGKKVRRRSPENVVDEMREHIEKRGIREFLFLDDTFNVPMEKAKDTLRAIIRELNGTRLFFSNGIRADHADDEFLDLLEAAGTVHIGFGIETASPRLQKLIGKNLDLEKAKKAIETASKRMITCVFSMIGFPTETREEAMETIRYISELDYVVQPLLSIVRVYRGTPLMKYLQPNEAQLRKLERQEQTMIHPRMLRDQRFYGDFFSREKVPLRGEDINELKWEWMRTVMGDRKRMENSYHIMQKFLDHGQILEFYRLLYYNKKFDDRSLARLLKQR